MQVKFVKRWNQEVCFPEVRTESYQADGPEH